MSKKVNQFLNAITNNMCSIDELEQMAYSILTSARSIIIIDEFEKLLVKKKKELALKNKDIDKILTIEGIIRTYKQIHIKQHQKRAKPVWNKTIIEKQRQKQDHVTNLDIHKNRRVIIAFNQSTHNHNDGEEFGKKPNEETISSHVPTINQEPRILSEAIVPISQTWLKQLIKDSSDYKEIGYFLPNANGRHKIAKNAKVYFLLPERNIVIGYAKLLYNQRLSARDIWNKLGKANGVQSLPNLIDVCTEIAETIHLPISELNQNSVMDFYCFSEFEFLEESEFVIVDVFTPLDVHPSNKELFKKRKLFPKHKIVNDFILIPDNEKKYRMNNSNVRMGQPKFRNEILRAYKDRCAVTEENCIEVIEAAHIQSYIDDMSNHPQNGIALRADIHILFDSGLITITEDLKVKISQRLKGSGYESLNIKKILVPDSIGYHPSKVALRWHNDNIFVDNK